MKKSISLLLMITSAMLATLSYGNESFPFVGGMTSDELTAAKKIQPPINDAKWHHEACVNSYQEVGVIKRQLSALNSLRNADRSPDHQAKIDREENQLKQDYETFSNNLKICEQGTYYREGIANVCAEFDLIGSDNPFCGLLEGKKLGQAKLTDDLLAMQKSVAWIKLGRLRDDRVNYQPQAWQATGSLGDPSELILPIRECVLSDTKLEDRPDCFRILGAEISRELRQKIGVFAMAGAKGLMNGQPYANNVGNWTLTLEMVRGSRELADHTVFDELKKLSTASGLPWSISNVVQYPRMHFQIMLDDLLFADDEADFFSVDGAGKEQWLGRGIFEKHEYGPFMYTSYESYRGHVSWIPSPEAWAIMRGTDTRKLIVQTRIFREDGAIDVMRFPVTMENFGAAVKQLGIDQQQSIQVVSNFESQLNELIATTEAELAKQQALAYSAEQARRYALNSVVKRGNKLLNEIVVIEPCATMSSLTNSATNDGVNLVRQYQTQFRQCVTNYSKHYEQARQNVWALYLEINELEKQHPLTAKLKSTYDNWQKALSGYYAEEKRIANHIRQLQEQQYQQANAEREVRIASRYRERSPRRNRNNSEYDEAARFFEDQRNPQPIFRDITVPRRANGYIGAGYY